MKTANKIIMAIAGAFLIIAAILKSHQMLTEPILSKGFWESWLFFVIQIPLELGLGIWLVSGLFRKAAWLLATIAFGGFIVVTSYLAMTGATTCGCFGKVHVNPLITLFAIDVPLFLLLLIFSPKGEKLLPPPWPSLKYFLSIAVPTFTILGILVPVLIFNKPAEKTNTYEVVHPNEWVTAKPVKPKPLIEPNTVKTAASPNKTEPNQNPVAENANQWPLLQSIDIADSLRSGIVVVLLYHFDCSDCMEAIPVYNKICSEMGGQGDIQFAFIAIPPYAQPEDEPVPADTKCLKGKLDASKTWYFQTPVVVLLQDGSVIKTWEAKAPSFEEILNALNS